MEYEELREALLEKFDISAETYRQRFRQTSTKPGETPTETYHRLKGLYARWIKPQQRTKEEIGELIILEQLLRVLPYDLRTWVKDHEPADGLTAARLAMQYTNARRGGRPHQPSTMIRGTSKTEQDKEGTVANVSMKSLICFYCQQQGHKAANCPMRKPKLSSYCYVPRGDDNTDSSELFMHCCTISVNGQTLKALIDTGSSMSLIKRGCVPENVINYVKTISVQCVHGDKVKYPTAEVTLNVNEKIYFVCVKVVDRLPADMVLGWDVPVLTDLLTRCDKPTKTLTVVSCPVLTRAQANAGLQPLPDLDDSLIQSCNKPRKTRRQRRMAKYLGIPTPNVSTDGLEGRDWKIPDKIAQLQEADVTLRPLFTKVGNDERKVQTLGAEMYVLQNGILYVMSDCVTRLVVPKCCRSLVLHLAHTIPWSGHLAHQKTYQRLSTRFFWPSMYTDVLTYCATCPVCQKNSAVRRSNRVPLYPLPVISTPFRRIAMDIVGPLERSSLGHQYILVVCDYATRYPEAFPLRSITTAKVISALVQC